MYQYSEFDRQFLQRRAAQFRDQLQRWQAGTLSGDAFKPLRLQNGWYVQRFAPMLRVAVPYGEINSAQLLCWPRWRATLTTRKPTTPPRPMPV